MYLSNSALRLTYTQCHWLLKEFIYNANRLSYFGLFWSKVTINKHQISLSWTVWKSLGVLLTETCSCSRLYGRYHKDFDPIVNSRSYFQQIFSRSKISFCGWSEHFVVRDRPYITSAHFWTFSDPPTHYVSQIWCQHT